MNTQKYFKQSESIKTGQVYIDLHTGLTFGVRYISYDRLASGSITKPNSTSDEVLNASPGQKWNFVFNGKDFEILLLELNYLDDTYKVQVTER